MPRIIEYPEELTLDPEDVVIIDSEGGGVRKVTVDALANALLPLMNQKLLVKQAGLDQVQNTADAEKSVKYATTAGSAESAKTAESATNAGYATTAGSATTAGTATNATNAEHAKSADSATSAGTATNANYATTAGSATTANSATTAGSATNATNATNAANASKLNNQDPSYYLNYNNLSNRPTIPAAPGTASTSAAGLVTLSTASTITANSGYALSASEKNPNVAGSLAAQIAQVAATAGASGINFYDAVMGVTMNGSGTNNITFSKPLDPSTVYLLTASTYSYASGDPADEIIGSETFLVFHMGSGTQPYRIVRLIDGDLASNASGSDNVGFGFYAYNVTFTNNILSLGSAQAFGASTADFILWSTGLKLVQYISRTFPSDNTSYASVSSSSGLEEGEKYLLCLNYAGSIGNLDLTAKSLSWSLSESYLIYVTSAKKYALRLMSAKWYNRHSNSYITQMKYAAPSVMIQWPYMNWFSIYFRPGTYGGNGVNKAVNMSLFKL